jgi:thiol-disulfide isomerase/thioredoxin
MPGRTILASAALATAVALFAAPSAPAQSPEGAFALPTAPNLWLNSPPLTAEMLAGKAAVLWFYEEDCPRCRGKWPEMYEAAKKFEGKPVVFIAINSGNSRSAVEQYGREVGLRWPTIVDTDRTLEAAADVGTISLQNIYQAKMLRPDGSLGRASFSDIEGSVNEVLPEAKWRVDPAEVPEALKAAWQQIEFGQFATAVPLVKKHLNATNPTVKAAAEKLQAASLKELAAAVEAAKIKRDTGGKWDAYKAYAALGVRFKGLEIPAEATTALTELAADSGVRNELAAKSQWESIERALAGGGLNKATAGRLERLTKQFAGTEGAAKAQAVLDKAGSL